MKQSDKSDMKDRMLMCIINHTNIFSNISVSMTIHNHEFNYSHLQSLCVTKLKKDTYNIVSCLWVDVPKVL